MSEWRECQFYKIANSINPDCEPTEEYIKKIKIFSPMIVVSQE